MALPRTITINTNTALAVVGAAVGCAAGTLTGVFLAGFITLIELKEPRKEPYLTKCILGGAAAGALAGAGLFAGGNMIAGKAFEMVGFQLKR